MDIGWTNTLVLKERYSLNLVRVFYSNMLISSQTTNRIVTSIGGIPIEFDVANLNKILRTPNKGLELYTARGIIDYPWYFVEDVV